MIITASSYSFEREGRKITLRGWIEYDGRILTEDDIASLFIGLESSDPHIYNEAVSRFCRCGGEFLAVCGRFAARDPMGLIQSSICPRGSVVDFISKKLICRIRADDFVFGVCGEDAAGSVPAAQADGADADYSGLSAAVEAAVSLRREGSITAFSGGIDSAYLAKLAGNPCICVGIEGSHDIAHAKEAAASVGLTKTNYIDIPRKDVEKALTEVIPVIPVKTPVEVSIASTVYFFTKWAGEAGFDRVMTGAGADELFGGYARYRDCASVKDTLEKDFTGLIMQTRRDQSVAAKNGVYLTCPYLDGYVVRAARSLPPESLCRDGMVKYPLRKAASAVIGDELAFYPKKAMQYGSGVMKEIQRLARDNGYKNSVQGYIDSIV